MDLSAARAALAEARANQRLALDSYHVSRLRAEMALGESIGWDTKRLGSNAEDRKRSFDAAVAGDSTCVAAQDDLRVAEVAVELAEVALDNLLDARRAAELDARERIIALLESGVGTEVLQAFVR